MKNKSFKVECIIPGNEDTMFFLAPNLEDAAEQFEALCGTDLPTSMLRWSEATRKEIKELEAMHPEEAYAIDMRPTPLLFNARKVGLR